MHYRSVADLNDAILQNLYKLPQNIDAVVGLPRSGLLAANLLCLALNVPLADAEGFLEGRLLTLGSTRKSASFDKMIEDMRTVVVIDDSIFSGETMQKMRERFEALNSKTHFVYCAVYGVEEKHPEVDIVFEKVPPPRIFQWNLMHHGHLLKHCCVDIDGVLCLDPTDWQNDDGAAYKKFLEEAVPMLVPTRPIGALVTSRLEKYRSLTEKWLAKHGIKYGALHMLDLPSKEERTRLGCHSQFKADVYAASNAVLFIESEYGQAQEIAAKAGKPVLCIETQLIIYPDSSLVTLRQNVRTLPLRLRMKYSFRISNSIFIKKIIRHFIGDHAYMWLKRRVT